MMKQPNTIVLPSVLPGTLDLHALNRLLRSGEAQLNWSAVTEAPEAALRQLLDGLDLVDAADALGLDTIPASVTEVVSAVLEASTSVPGHTPRRSHATSGSDHVRAGGEEAAMPVTWSSPLTQPDVLPEPEGGTFDQTSHPADVVNQATPENDQPARSPVLATESHAKLRRRLQEMVRMELLGPVGGEEEEIADENVTDRYILGMLAPRHMQVDSREQDALAVSADEATEDGNVDLPATSSTTLFPSSFGFTCCVSGEAEALRITARWGRYERTKSETLTNPKTGNPKSVWKRHPMSGVIERLPLRAGTVEQQHLSDEQTEVYIRGEIRRLGEDWIVTLFLVNGQEERKRSKDSAWLFQPELALEAPDGAAIFRRHAIMHGYQYLDPVDQREQRAMAMLYRKRVEFAVGHGVSVHAVVSAVDPTMARRIETQVIPMFELPQTISSTAREIPALADLVLDMKSLAELDVEKLPAALAPLPGAYAQWIAMQANRISDPTAGLTGHEQAFEEAIAACQVALGRIREGIALLGSDARAAAAFRFMNHAMWLQRLHSLAAEATRRGEKRTFEEFDHPDNRTWRLFQLAFILLNLPALTDLHHPERGPDADAVADLLWFPTGGGKTEAYLGLTAYTLAMRRLQGSISSRTGEVGVAVLMRYTLRLLTLQQFQRAAALICACERIRREAEAHGDRRWGETPFRLGLWVGQRTTPNYTDESAEAIRQEHGHYKPASAFGGSGSPAQLTYCPWCGAPINPGRDIEVSTVTQGTGRTLIYCSDPMGVCPFSKRQAPGEGLPVIVVDEEIYRRLPSLVIATVDKFAQLPWKGPVGMLFGQVTGYCPRHGYRSSDLADSDSHRARDNLPAVRTQPCGPLRPPDLIIQDELHLISGPLGSLVGLYESVVDRLATWEVDGRRIRPKVVASTATVRRASEQMHALFMRSVTVFPPHGIDVEDNFFSRQIRPSDESPGRLYVGMCAFGRRMKLALIRVYAAYLLSAQTLFRDYGTLIDPWMTLVGYFNSMRELAGMRRLVEENVRTALGHGEEHGFARRPRPILEELTSRKGAVDIPRILDWMETAFTVAQVRRAAAKPVAKGEMQVKGSPPPLDVLLATNMISVGIDVKRLGLMVVADQPKTTAEYIQATSRVGRSFPGLVCTVFNWARPRDLSHFETFEHYHATFYAQVEALSVTPFAPRAIDRGLSALLTALIRQRGAEFNSNARAAAITAEHPYVREAIADLVERARRVSNNVQIVSLVEQELESRLKVWLSEATNHTGGRVLGYQEQNDGKTVGLLHSPELKLWQPFTCLNSLRDVEPPITLILDDRPMGNDTQHLFMPAAIASDRVHGESTDEEANDDF